MLLNVAVSMSVISLVTLTIINLFIPNHCFSIVAISVVYILICVLYTKSGGWLHAKHRLLRATIDEKSNTLLVTFTHNTRALTRNL